MKKIYLATPYSGTFVEESIRYIQTCKLCAQVIKSGHYIFSPIAHSHGIALYGGLDRGIDFWQEHNTTWLDWADELWIGRLQGWNQSRGVLWESEHTMQAGKPVHFIDLKKED